MEGSSSMQDWLAPRHVCTALMPILRSAFQAQEASAPDVAGGSGDAGFRRALRSKHTAQTMLQYAFQNNPIDAIIDAIADAIAKEACDVYADPDVVSRPASRREAEAQPMYAAVIAAVRAVEDDAALATEAEGVTVSAVIAADERDGAADGDGDGGRPRGGSKSMAELSSWRSSVSSTTAGDDLHELWSASSWAEGLGLSEIVAEALTAPLRAGKARYARKGGRWGRGKRSDSGGAAPADANVARYELPYVKELGRLATDGGLTFEAFVEFLLASALVPEIAAVLWDEAKAIAEEMPANTAELVDKFKQDGCFEMSYGSISTFFGGLEGLIGPPDPKMLPRMVYEHCNSDDSRQPIVATNYMTTTTPEIEWLFVTVGRAADPRAVAALAARGLTTWPVEEKLLAPGGNREHMRTPIAPDDPTMLSQREEVNGRLAEQKTSALCDEEFYGARLYTGPMFLKYNGTLRALASSSAPAPRKKLRRAGHWQRSTRQSQRPRASLAAEGEGSPAKAAVNTYTTTLHCINSAIIKLSKLMTAETVYRGISGAMLPDSFWRPNAQKVRGGVEYAFMSTTLEEDVAKFYAAGGAKGSKAGVLFEVQMGMIDRGASMEWLSQYPHEREITFAPLTGLEVVNTTIDQSVLVVQVRLNINLQALTIEEVVSKRHKLCREIAQNVVSNFRPEKNDAWAPLVELDPQAPAKAKAELLRVAASVVEAPAHEFNEDSAFGERVNAIVAARAGVEWSVGLAAILSKCGLASVAELKAKGAAACAPVFRASEAALGDEMMSAVCILHQLGYETIEIDITQNTIGPASTKRWAELLDVRDLPKLQILGNWGNELGDAGIIHIADAISRGRLGGLEQMRCGANKIGEDGFTHLMEVLLTGVNPNLTVVGFYDNHTLGDQSVTTMAAVAAAGHLRKLEKTDLSTNAVGDDGLVALCAAEREHGAFPSLLEMRVAFNRFTDRGALALAATLAAGGFPKLTLLDFTMNKLITQKGRDALTASCDGTDGPKRPFVPAA